MVRFAYDVAYAARNIERVRDRFTHDFVWHARPEWPGRAAYSADEMTELWADLDETYSEFELVPVEFEQLGSDHVLVKVLMSSCLRGTDARIENTMWHLWRIEDKPSEAWGFSTRTEALEAARLSK